MAATCYRPSRVPLHLSIFPSPSPAVSPTAAGFAQSPSPRCHSSTQLRKTLPVRVWLKFLSPSTAPVASGAISPICPPAWGLLPTACGHRPSAWRLSLSADRPARSRRSSSRRARIAGKSSAARGRVTSPLPLILPSPARCAADWEIMVNGASVDLLDEWKFKVELTIHRFHCTAMAATSGLSSATGATPNRF